MKTYKMPAAVYEAPDMESGFEILDQCAEIMADYRAADFPVFPDSEPYVERMMAAGCTCEEAVDILSTMVREEV